MVEEAEIILSLFRRIDLRLAGLLICEALDHADVRIARLVIRQYLTDVSVASQILVDLAGCLSSGLDCHDNGLGSVYTVACCEDARDRCLLYK